MSIERELLKNWTETTYQEPEVQLAAGPAETVTDSGPAFTMPGMGKRSKKSEVGQNLPVLAADAAAGAGKGLVSGIAGFAGDIESLYQGVKGVITRGGDEGALDAFLKGMAQKTIAPTSDDVSKWLDANVGPVVPANSGMSPEMQKAREGAAGAGEFAGQLAADPTVAIKGAKAVAKGAKTLAPKAAEMIVDATEKTGMPVTGLGIVEKSLTSKGAKLTPEIEVPSAGDIKKPAFKKWFEGSKLIDDKGQPIVMYHGTTRNFESFDPNASESPGSSPIGAMFFTDDPAFAEQFRGTSGNIMPVYVSAKNPFDFENAKHRSALIDLLMQKVGIYKNAPDQESMRKVLDADIEKKDGTANWGVIEMKESLESLKELGFDSFYVREGGRKILACLTPSR